MTPSDLQDETQWKHKTSNKQQFWCWETFMFHYISSNIPWRFKIFQSWFIDTIPNNYVLQYIIQLSIQFQHHSHCSSLLQYVFPSYSSLTLFQLPTWCFHSINSISIRALFARPAAEHVIHLHLCLALRLRHIFAATQGFGLCSTGWCIQDGGFG